MNSGLLLRPILRQSCLRGTLVASQRPLLSEAPSSILHRTFLTNAFKSQPRPRSIASTLHQRVHQRFQSTYAGFSGDAGRAYTSQEWWTKVLATAGVVAAGTVGINWFLNRETRAPLDAFERSYMNQTFGYFGAGLAVVTAVAVAMHKNGISYRVMRANPWALMGVSLVGGIGSMMGVFYTSPENTVAKHACWFAFQAFQALTLSPLLFMYPAILMRAGLYTAGMMGSIAYVGATARTDQYLYLGGPLLAGLVVVALSSLAPMVLPVTAARTLMFSQSISLYGGLAVFGGFTLYDVQKMLNHARAAKVGLIPNDPIKESISFELDFINIFIRMVAILSGGSNRRH